MTKFPKIKQATKTLKEEAIAASNTMQMMVEYAQEGNVTVSELYENVTNILANIATTASEGRPLKLMHLNSIASFMAGVEAIAKALPTTQDEARKQNTLRVLAAAGVQPDGTVSYATTPIAQLGARKQDLQGKYAAMVQDYAQSTARGEPAGMELAQAARMLQTQIDRAMRQATSSGQQNRFAQAGPSMAGTARGTI